MAKHTWNGHEIDVACYSEPKFLWQAYGFKVHVDGALVGRSPDHFEVRTIVPFQVDDGGILRHARVVGTFPSTAAWTPYRIFVEETQIARGVTRAPNWYATYAVLLGFILVLLFLFYLIH